MTTMNSDTGLEDKKLDSLLVLGSKIIVHRPAALVVELVSLTDKETNKVATHFSLQATVFWQDWSHVEAASAQEPVPIKTLCQTVTLRRGEAADLARALLDVLALAELAAPEKPQPFEAAVPPRPSCCAE